MVPNREAIASYPVSCPGVARRRHNYPVRPIGGFDFTATEDEISHRVPVLPEDRHAVASLTVFDDGTRQVGCPFLQGTLCTAAKNGIPSDQARLTGTSAIPTECIHLNPSEK